MFPEDQPFVHHCRSISSFPKYLDLPMYYLRYRLRIVQIVSQATIIVNYKKFYLFENSYINGDFRRVESIDRMKSKHGKFLV